MGVQCAFILVGDTHLYTWVIKTSLTSLDANEPLGIITKIVCRLRNASRVPLPLSLYANVGIVVVFLGREANPYQAEYRIQNFQLIWLQQWLHLLMLEISQISSVSCITFLSNLVKIIKRVEINWGYRTKRRKQRKGRLYIRLCTNFGCQWTYFTSVH